MTTLASKDQSGTLTANEGETEDLRTRSFKRFRLPDAPDGRKRYRVGGAIGPVHYREDPFDTAESWKEIDLDVQLTPDKAWDAEVSSNGYQVRLWQNRTIAGKVVRYIAQFRRAGKSLTMAPAALLYVNGAGQRQLISRPVAGISPTIDNDANTVTWADCFGSGIHFRYNLRPDEFFKTLVIDNKTDLPAPTIGTTGLRLALVLTLAWDAQAGNGFAASQDVSELTGDDDDGTADESLDDAGDYPHTDERGPLFWVKKPRAWDASGDVPMRMDIRRKDQRVYALCSVSRATANNAAYPLTIDVAITEENTVQRAESQGGTWPGTGFSNTVSLLIGAESPNFYAGGASFATVPIPQGATIDSATIGINPSGNYTNSTNVDVYCEAADNAAVFNTTTRKVGLVPRTTANTNWAMGTWTNLVVDTSPNIAGPVGEVVARSGWASNNNLNILILNHATTLPATSEFRSTQGSGNVFNATYTAGASGPVMPIFIHHYQQQGIM